MSACGGETLTLILTGENTINPLINPALLKARASVDVNRAIDSAYSISRNSQIKYEMKRTSHNSADSKNTLLKGVS